MDTLTVVFSIFVVETPGDNGTTDAIHKPLGVVKLRATVTNAYNSIVRPGYYDITNVDIIDGKPLVKHELKRIVTWARPFALQAKAGERVEACGLLEEVNNGKETYCQVVLGYFDTYTTTRGEEEYLKALLKEQ